MCAEPKSLILRLELEKPTENLQRKALLELRETPENVEKGLKELKALLAAEKDLVANVSDDEWLLAFLRSCKFYPESSRDLVKCFYTMRHKYSEVTALLLPNKLRHVFEANIVSILPQRDQHGRRIVVSLSGKQWNQRVISIDETFSCGVLCTDMVQREPATQINGIVYILDLDDLSFDQALKFTPYNLKRCLAFVQDENPLRVKAFHIVNQPRIFQPIFAAIRPFFSAKFAKRIIMHGNNYESLHQYIAPECLPKCYGGSLESKLMYGPETFELLAPHSKYFEELQKFGLKKATKE